MASKASRDHHEQRALEAATHRKARLAEEHEKEVRARERRRVAAMLSGGASTLPPDAPRGSAVGFDHTGFAPGAAV